MTALALEELAVGSPGTIEHFIAWASKLTLDNGEPWNLESFQIELASDLLAGYREIWIIIPEGNAKTTLLAGFALYHAQHTLAPWVPIGAASRDQAEILFGQAAGFVERSKELQRHFRVHEGYRKIRALRQGGKGIKVYAYDPKTGDGVIPTLALCDELHRHDDLRLYRLWKGKLGKRNGQIATISTAGEPGSDFEEMRETIRNAAIERTYVGCHLRAAGANLVYHEWQVPKVELAKDLEIVKQANPLSMITLEYLEEKLGSETLDFGEDWLRLTCNIATRSSRAAIAESDWDALQTDEEIPEGVPVAVGADFAWQIDTTAVIPLWMPSVSKRLFGDPEILTPPRDGTMLDVEAVKAAFLRIHNRNPIDLAVMDVTRAQDVAQWLSNEYGITVVDRAQTNALAILDYENWMQAMRDGSLHHTGHRELRRHVLNAIARSLPGDQRRFDRPSTSRNTKAGRQERRVIDCLTAASMVHSSKLADMLSAPPARVRAIDLSTV